MERGNLPQPVSCPGCGSTDTFSVGGIPPSNQFAGRVLEKERDGGELLRCRSCYLAFREPRPTSRELADLYREGSSENWSVAEEWRSDWALIRQWLQGQDHVHSILDVGCYDGRLLESLGSGYALNGVEIHAGAAEQARSRGVSIVADDFTALGAIGQQYDAVMAVDVLEHSLDPRTFVSSLAALARPGGYVILTTGNSNAVSWRFMGGSYWYCHIAEHMTFINPDWAERAAGELGLQLAHLDFFSRAEAAPTLKKRLYEMATNVLRRLAPPLFAQLRRMGLGGIDLQRYPGMVMAPPIWMTARDHLFLVYCKQ